MLVDTCIQYSAVFSILKSALIPNVTKKVNINAIEKLGGQLDIIQNAFRSYKVIFANSDKLE